MEPIMTVEVTAPKEAQGTVMTQFARRKGIIRNTEFSEGWFTLEVEVPLYEMFGYSSALRTVTQGKGEFSMEYSRYAPASPELIQQLIEQYEADQAALSGNPSANKKKTSKR
ncbi:Elongation factor EFG domain V-like [Trinorchestia longiramus]|nr:Elongation factor EFG domain V-like [Trinorchestia longiramus]